MTGSSTYPFLYYGNRPVAWETPFQSWEVRFVDEVDDEARATVARIVKREMEGKAYYVSYWFEAGAWACMVTGAQDFHTREFEELFGQHEALFRAIHGEVPIAEVVHMNSVRRGGSDWDRWSHEQQAWPTSPHPVWAAGPLRYPRLFGRDDGYIEPPTDAPPAEGRVVVAFAQMLED